MTWARRLAAALAIATMPGMAMAAADILVHRDPGCGCCEAWAAQVRHAFGRSVRMEDDRDRAGGFGARVPADLRSCHSAMIDGMLFEGHVPVADMMRVLKTRPAGVAGLAVAGMPMDSPGMEVPGRAAQSYDVIAFGPAGRTLFAHHGGGG